MAAFALAVMLCLGLCIGIFTQFFSARLTKVLLDFQVQGISSEVLAQLRADPEVDLEHLNFLLRNLPIEGEGLWHLGRSGWLDSARAQGLSLKDLTTSDDKRELVLESLKLDSFDAVLDLDKSLGRIREILWSSRVAHPDLLELSLVLELKNDEVAVLTGELQPGFPGMSRSPVLASVGNSASFLPKRLWIGLHPSWPGDYQSFQSGALLQSPLNGEDGALGALRIRVSDELAQQVVTQQTKSIAIAASLAGVLMALGFFVLAAYIRHSSSELVALPLMTLSQLLSDVDREGDGHISKEDIEEILPSLRSFQQELHAAREIDEVTQAARSHLELLSTTLAENEAIQLKLKDALVRLEEASGALVQSSKGWMLTELGAWVAHDLNNKLQGAYAISSNWLERDKPCPVKHLKFLHLSLEKSIEQIDQFSNLSRPQDQDVVRRVEVEALIEDLKLLVSQRIQQVNANLECEIQNGLHYLNISPGKFQDMLMNLIFNACDAVAGLSPEKRRISLRVEGASITVQDWGVGIDSTDIPKLFERPFFTTKSEGGTGLGLRIVSSVAAEYQGGVNCVSELGRGSTFVVSLGSEHVELP